MNIKTQVIDEIICVGIVLFSMDDEVVLENSEGAPKQGSTLDFTAAARMSLRSLGTLTLTL